MFHLGFGLVTEHEAEVDQSRTTGAGIDGLVERITALDPKWLRGKDGEGRTLAELLTKIEVWQKTADGEDVPIGLAGRLQSWWIKVYKV